jgi:hypothetical protein
LLSVGGGARVGEGSLVQHVGFLSHSRYSNVNSGESVNCQFRGEASNDIHFDILQDSSEEACLSVTGEVAPHRRSPFYEVPVLNITNPVKVTGHLFFDASHKPCMNGEPQESLKRISLWEIHPAYKIDVCRAKTITECSVTDENVWVPISRFRNTADLESDEEH